MALLAEWPWQRIGNLKYFLFVPIILKALHSSCYERSHSHNWYLHILIVSSLRYIQHQCWNSYSRLYFFVKKHQIRQFGTDFAQVDREFHCDNFIIFQALVGAAVPMFIPGCRDLPLWSLSGMISTLFVHMGVTESLYYWTHKALHERSFLCQYHSHHHLSTTPEPSTAGTRTFLEELMQTSLIALALTGSILGGRASIGLLYVYILAFDFLKQMGHCNYEFVPLWAFRVFPPLKFLLYSPSYHSLHHIDQRTNLCLFMPLYDYLGGTRNKNTWPLYLSLRKDSKVKVPQFVFLVHLIDILSTTQVAPYLSRTFSSVPYRVQWYLWPTSPLCLIAMFCLWIWGRTSVSCEYILRSLYAQTWAIPRYGFHYFLPFGKQAINELIEKAILDADALGVKVISLAALNKNEALNGGGLMFVEKHKNLRVRVVHGNTLTAAVILSEISPSVREVFLTGATSKLGRAITIYLCRKSIRVLMLTSSRERYEHILSEVPADQRPYLVHVTKYQAGQHCKTWIVGKWITRREQGWAPPGTHFHQFVVPPVQEVRKDCTYGKLAGMHLPNDVIGVRTCEYTFGRGVVAACHAGGLLHALEGWDHHEVGSINVDRIDVVWKAARKHGFSPV